MKLDTPFVDAHTKVSELAAQNGQLILLREILQWAKDNQSFIAKKAMDELIEIATRYGA